MTTTRIRGGRIIDPAQQIDRSADLLIRDGRIVGIDESAESVDADGGHSVILDQVTNGLMIRMACLYLLNQQNKDNANPTQ